MYRLLPFTETPVGAQAKKMAKHALVAKAALDVTDNRFSALFTQPQFALDPTDPRYAVCLRAATRSIRSLSGRCTARVFDMRRYKSAGDVDAIRKESLKRRKQQPRADLEPIAVEGDAGAYSEKVELASMVANLKRKAKQK